MTSKGMSLAHRTNLCMQVSIHFDYIFSISDTVTSLRNTAISLCNTVISLCNTVISLCNTVISLCNIYLYLVCLTEVVILSMSWTQAVTSPQLCVGPDLTVMRVRNKFVFSSHFIFLHCYSCLCISHTYNVSIVYF